MTRRIQSRAVLQEHRVLLVRGGGHRQARTRHQHQAQQTWLQQTIKVCQNVNIFLLWFLFQLWIANWTLPSQHPLSVYFIYEKKNHMKYTICLVYSAWNPFDNRTVCSRKEWVKCEGMKRDQFLAQIQVSWYLWSVHISYLF